MYTASGFTADNSSVVEPVPGVLTVGSGFFYSVRSGSGSITPRFVTLRIAEQEPVFFVWFRLQSRYRTFSAEAPAFSYTADKSIVVEPVPGVLTVGSGSGFF